MIGIPSSTTYSITFIISNNSLVKVYPNMAAFFSNPSSTIEIIIKKKENHTPMA